ISAPEPLNWVCILSPGPRIAAITAHRILLRDGVPVAALKAGQLISLEAEAADPAHQLERTLRVGSLSPAPRPYYAFREWAACSLGAKAIPKPFSNLGSFGTAGPRELCIAQSDALERL